MPKTLREEFPSVLDIFYGDYQKYRHVSEIMNKEVTMIKETATMLEAAKIMGKKHIGSLLVKGKERPAGIVTERDLLTRVIAANKDPKRVKVFDVMSPRLITIKPQVTIREAARTMIKEKGRLIVMEERDLVGILTASDLIRSLPEAPETLTLVRRFMTKQVASVKPNVKVRDTAIKMGKERIGSVIIKKGEKPWGIFTERDLLTKVIYMGGNLDEIVEKYSSTPLITIAKDYSIHKAARTMVANHVRRLPVLEKGKLIGIITARDLVEAYAL
jgi:CBS domain-containing protein